MKSSNICLCDRCRNPYEQVIRAQHYKVERFIPEHGSYTYNFCNECRGDLERFLRNVSVRKRVSFKETKEGKKL
jgi:hypothetical protein